MRFSGYGSEILVWPFGESAFPASGAVLSVGSNRGVVTASDIAIGENRLLDSLCARDKGFNRDNLKRINRIDVSMKVVGFMPSMKLCSDERLPFAGAAP
jgi:hypothetical protein